MRIDVSEVKTYRECSRKWLYSSRNAYHLVTLAPNPNFTFGTLMHEALHGMYLGGNFDEIFDKTLRELTDPAEQRVMTTILRGYYETVLPQDLSDFQVLDIEYGFKLYLPEFAGTKRVHPLTNEVEDEGVVLCGSIDMIALKREDNSIWGFEHKSAKAFREPVFTRMDEQPRLYTEALAAWVNRKNEQMRLNWRAAQLLSMPAGKKEPEYYTLGGIYINQCKKTVKFFQYQRDACIYTLEDRKEFLKSFIQTCLIINDKPSLTPEPGAMKCMLCGYKSICEYSGFATPSRASILQEFEEEYEVREVDHLEEKIERAGPVEE